MSVLQKNQSLFLFFCACDWIVFVHVIGLFLRRWLIRCCLCMWLDCFCACDWIVRFNKLIDKFAYSHTTPCTRVLRFQSHTTSHSSLLTSHLTHTFSLTLSLPTYSQTQHIHQPNKTQHVTSYNYEPNKQILKLSCIQYFENILN